MYINIINYNLSSTPIVIILSVLVLISLVGLKKVNNYKEYYFFITCILYAFFIYFLVASSYRVGTLYIIHFFTAPIFLYLYFSSVFDLKYFIKKHYQQLLKYYIFIIFLSIVVSIFPLHVLCRPFCGHQVSRSPSTSSLSAPRQQPTSNFRQPPEFKFL